MTATRYHLTPASKNAKTGPIPVTTTSADTCPDACPLKAGNGCYAGGGPLAIHWRALTEGKRGGTLADLAKAIRRMPAGQLWRHNQAGDLPGIGDAIDAVDLAALVAANRGRKGFTFTHKPVTGAAHEGNREAVKAANAAGFTVNLSANNLGEADALLAADCGPVAVIVPEDMPGKFQTPAGYRGVVCPAQQRDDMDCARCGLCAKQNRGVVVGFRVHGSLKKRAIAATLV